MVSCTRTRAPALTLPDAALVPPDVLGIVHRLVAPGDGESSVHGLQVEVPGGVGHAQAVVEAARALLAQDQVPAFVPLGQEGHGHPHHLVLGGAACEGEAPQVVISQPGTGHELRRLGFEGGEVPVQGQKDEDVLLGVPPA
jgi:hypothetical protein